MYMVGKHSVLNLSDIHYSTIIQKATTNKNVDEYCFVTYTWSLIGGYPIVFPSRTKGPISLSSFPGYGSFPFKK